MVNDPHSKLLRIFIGELDKVDHEPLYEQIVFEAKKHKMAGATVLRGIMSYGASSLIHSSKLLRLSEDLPVVVELVDTEENINNFLPVVEGLIERSARGGLVTIEKADVRYYKPKKNN